MPANWPDAVFHQLRTEGAFLVSAEWKKGQTTWIRIESLAGEPCVLQTDLADFKIVADREIKVERMEGPRGQTRWMIDLKQGESVLVKRGK